MKVSELMQAMSEAGAPMEAILIAVRALEERDAVIEAKRAVERDRKRRQRAKDQDTDGTVTGQSRDTGGTVRGHSEDPSLSRPLSPLTPLTPTHTHPDNNPRVRKGTPAKPDGVKDQTWLDFLELRKRKRAPLTETAMSGIESEARKAGWSMEAALAKCLARGWQGFEADWVRGEAPPAADDVSPLLKRVRALKARETSSMEASQ